MAELTDAHGGATGASVPPAGHSWRRRAMGVLWPSFLMAGVLEMVVFALVEPDAMRWFGGVPVGLSASAVYTLAFFIFWVVIASAGSLTLLLALSAEDINRGDAAQQGSR